MRTTFEYFNLDSLKSTVLPLYMKLLKATIVPLHMVLQKNVVSEIQDIHQYICHTQSSNIQIHEISFVNFYTSKLAKSAIALDFKEKFVKIYYFYLISRKKIVKSCYVHVPQCGKVLKNAITLKNFREINSLVTSLVKTLI